MTGRFEIWAAAALVLVSASCTKVEQDLEPESRKVSFAVTVTRGGTQTRGGYEVSDNAYNLNPSIPFGLVGVDLNSGSLLVDNEGVKDSGSGAYSAFLDNGLWEHSAPITFSAYYPYTRDIHYGDGYRTYTIPYSAEETSAGPLVSKTVQRAVDQMNMIPLAFQHITNDIGFKICDATEDPNLQGLIHLRKVTATQVAQAGVFENDIALSQGIWLKQGYYRDVVVFEGDAKLGVGSEGELFVGKNELVSKKAESFRYYSIPDVILLGKQTVEVEYDVEGFTLNDFYYPPLEGMTARFSLYGVLPDDTFIYGKQYTFHLGMDLGTVYQAITFSPSVSGWDTKIYEDNSDF